MIIDHSSVGLPVRPAGTIRFGRPALLRACLLFGLRGPRRLRRPNQFRIGLGRFFEFRAAVTTRQDGRLTKTAEYATHLESSEKGKISFLIGRITAFLAGQRLLRVRYLVHFDTVLLARGEALGGIRPDLIGPSGSGGVVAIEAKGNGRDYDASRTTKAKRQLHDTPYELSLDGQDAEMLVAHQSYFHAGVLRIRLEDPPSNNQDTVPLELSTSVLRTCYLLEHLRYFVGSRELTVAEGFVLRELDAGAVVGMPEEMFSAAPMAAVAAAVRTGYSTARTPRRQVAEALEALDSFAARFAPAEDWSYDRTSVGRFEGEMDSEKFFVGFDPSVSW